MMTEAYTLFQTRYYSNKYCSYYNIISDNICICKIIYYILCKLNFKVENGTTYT